VNGTPRNAQSLLHLASEHREMERRARQLVHLVEKPLEEIQIPAATLDLQLHLRELRERLKRHFAEEAAGGYLEEAVARMPKLATDADAVERQHPQLLRDLAALTESAAVVRSSSDAWNQIGIVVRRVAGDVLAHEMAENRIVQQGFNEDPDLFDLDNNNVD
jgi:hypothetical protein